MSSQPITARTNNPEKFSRLMEIVAGMGPDATGDEVRERAYAVGFGKVSSAMLVAVLNELWPQRKKRNGGRPTGTSNTKPMLPESFADEFATCPNCKSIRTRAMGADYRNKEHRAMGIKKRRHVCHDCGQMYRTLAPVSHILSAKRLSRVAAALVTEKVCTKCKQTLPVSAFSPVSGQTLFLRPNCRKCLNQRRHETQIGKTLAIYGLTVEGYEEIVRRQGGRCAICQTTEPGGRCRTWPVDHCHKTGKVRGLLCNKCNLGIGNFNDDVERLEAAASYIRNGGGGG